MPLSPESRWQILRSLNQGAKTQFTTYSPSGPRGVIHQLLPWPYSMISGSPGILSVHGLSCNVFIESCSYHGLLSSATWWLIKMRFNYELRHLSEPPHISMRLEDLDGCPWLAWVSWKIQTNPNQAPLISHNHASTKLFLFTVWLALFVFASITVFALTSTMSMLNLESINIFTYYQQIQQCSETFGEKRWSHGINDSRGNFIKLFLFKHTNPSTWHLAWSGKCMAFPLCMA